MTMSTFSNRVLTPAMLRTGRTAAYRLSFLRNCTLTDWNPLPTGVVTGPLSATLCAWMAASVRCGRTWSYPRSTADAPADSSTHSTFSPAAARTRFVADVTSGPMPSPGMRTMVCLAMGVTAPGGWTTGYYTGGRFGR